MFLSQQYHRAWRAEAHQRALRTVIVIGFIKVSSFLQNTSEVELSFRPSFCGAGCHSFSLLLPACSFCCELLGT